MITMRQIRSLAGEIGRKFRPERVILFGSYAYGRPTPDSDADFLVIMPFRGSSLQKAAEICGEIDPSFPIDLLVRSPQEVRRRLRWNDFFLQEIMEKGKVLYEAADARVGAKGGRRSEQRHAGVARSKGPEL